MPSEQTECNLSRETGHPSDSVADPAMLHNPEKVSLQQVGHLYGDRPLSQASGQTVPLGNKLQPADSWKLPSLPARLVPFPQTNTTSWCGLPCASQVSSLPAVLED